MRQLRPKQEESGTYYRWNFKNYRNSTWSDVENKDAKAWRWFPLILNSCSKIWAFPLQELGVLFFTLEVRPWNLDKKQMLPRATSISRRNRNFLLHCLAEFGPCDGSVAVFNLKQAGNLPVKPESSQLIDILTKAHLYMWLSSRRPLKAWERPQLLQNKSYKHASRRKPLTIP